MLDSRTNTAREGQGRMIRESYQLVVSGLLAVQRQNIKLVRYSAGVLLEEAEKQREAFRSMFEDSFRTYMGLLYLSVSSPRNGGGTGRSDLPMEDYDQISVREISGQLNELSAAEVEEIKEYEKKSQNRATLIERFDRSQV
jgi:hypothetical protein